LLVSVRNREEALVALAGGAAVIDAKDPAAGPLGPVSIEAFESIAAAIGDAAPVSAALGDADDRDRVEERARAFTGAGAAFVKIGFARLDRHDEVTARIAAARRGVKGSGAVVAVAYADYTAAGALPPDVIATAAQSAGAQGVLRDTATKAGPGLLSAVSVDWLAQWIRTAHSGGLFVALAGRLTASDIAQVRALGAEIVGVRGAACEGGRNGVVTAGRVRELATALQVPMLRTRATEDAPAMPS
jgi:uncharacterized protein (UPF0264 family)